MRQLGSTIVAFTLLALAGPLHALPIGGGGTGGTGGGGSGGSGGGGDPPPGCAANATGSLSVTPSTLDRTTDPSLTVLVSWYQTRAREFAPRSTASPSPAVPSSPARRATAARSASPASRAARPSCSPRSPRRVKYGVASALGHRRRRPRPHRALARRRARQRRRRRLQRALDAALHGERRARAGARRAPLSLGERLVGTSASASSRSDACTT